MSKRKILALALTVAMIAILAVGGTLAYFTDTDTDKNVFTVGNVSIRQDEWMRTADNSGLTAYEDPETVYPAVIYDANGNPTTVWNSTVYVEDTTKQYTVAGLDDTFQMPDKNRMKNVVDKIVTVTNTGKNDAYVRTILLIEDADGKVMANLEMMYDSVHYPANFVGYVTIDNTRYYVIEFVHKEAIASGETTYPSAMAFWMNPSMKASDVPADFDIIAYSQAVQAEGFATAEEALDAAFGDVTTANTAWYK